MKTRICPPNSPILTRLSLLIASFAFTSVATAQDDALFDLSLEQLLQIKVVTAASGYEQQLSQAPGSVTVITQQEWLAAGARELNDVLNMVPGVHIGKSTTGLLISKTVIRGVSGNFGQQVLVLIDGVPIKYWQDSGQAMSDHLSLASFERVEVVRSPGSAIYGADAVGGVINLVSNKKLDKAITVRTGNFDTQELEWTHQHSFDQGAWRITAEHHRSDDDPNKIATSDLQTVFDNTFGTSASQAPGRVDEHYAISQVNAQLDWDKLSLQVHYWNNTDLGLGHGVASALDSTGSGSKKNIQYNASYTVLNTSRHTLTLAAHHNNQSTHTYLHVFPPGTQLPIGADGNIDFIQPENIVTFTDGYVGTPSNNTRTTDVNATYFLDLDTHHTRIQVGHQEQAYKAKERKNFGPSILDGTQLVVDGTLTDVTNTPYIYIPESQRDVTYLSVEDTWQLHPSFRATLGMRLDSYSDVGSTFNPRLNLQWQAANKITFNTYAGTAFRAPSYTELYAQNNPAGVGNSKLKPEKARTYQSGINSAVHFNESVDVNINFYQYRIDNIIEFVNQQESGIQLSSNAGKQIGWGSEIEFNWQYNNKLLLKGHYSYLDAHDKFDNSLPDVANHSVYVQAHYKVNQHWQIFANSKWISERPRYANDSRDALEGYNMTTIHVTWNQPRYSIALNIANAFNTDASEPSNSSLPDDFPLAGRQTMLAFTYHY